MTAPRLPRLRRGARVHWAVVSPSKRAGDTVDESGRRRPARARTATARGHGAPTTRRRRPAPVAEPRRRSVVSPGARRRPSGDRRRSVARRRARSPSAVAFELPEDDASGGRRPRSTTSTGRASPAVAGPVDEAARGAGHRAAAASPSAAEAHGRAVAIPPPLAADRRASSRTPTCRAGPDAGRSAVPLPVTIPTGAAGRRARVDDGAPSPDARSTPPGSARTRRRRCRRTASRPVPRIVGRRPRVRRVTRVVRHVDPWSVFKVAIVFNLVLYGVLLTAGVLLWNVAYATGTVDNLERFFESFGWSDFEFDGGAIYHASWIAGLFGVDRPDRRGRAGGHAVQPDHRPRRRRPHDGARGGGAGAHDGADAPLRRAPPGTGADPSAGLRREVDRLEPTVRHRRADPPAGPAHVPGDGGGCPISR